MSFLIYQFRKILDRWNTNIAAAMTERWYQGIVQDVAEELKQDWLKEYFEKEEKEKWK